MSEPKFHVGQHVAVCSPDLSLVVPQTIVINRRYDPSTRAWADDACTKIKVFPEGWYYQVPEQRTNWLGQPVWLGEWCLRPIGPGEYDSLPTSTETPTEVEQ